MDAAVNAPSACPVPGCPNAKALIDPFCQLHLGQVPAPLMRRIRRRHARRQAAAYQAGVQEALRHLRRLAAAPTTGQQLELGA